MSLTIEFKHPAFRKEHQSVSIDLPTPALPGNQPAPAFGFMHEVEMMREMGQGPRRQL